MAEKYVSVSELRKLLGVPEDGQCTGCQFSTFHGCKDDSIQRACEAIDDAPEADVRPVMRGEWIPTCIYDYYYKCSACGEIGPLEPQGEGVFRFNFCPNCGADMRDVKVDG